MNHDEILAIRIFVLKLAFRRMLNEHGGLNAKKFPESRVHRPISRFPLLPRSARCMHKNGGGCLRQSGCLPSLFDVVRKRRLGHVSTSFLRCNITTSTPRSISKRCFRVAVPIHIPAIITTPEHVSDAVSSTDIPVGVKQCPTFCRVFAHQSIIAFTHHRVFESVCHNNLLGHVLTVRALRVFVKNQFRTIERCAEKLLSIGALGDGDFLAAIRAIPTGQIKLDELL